MTYIAHSDIAQDGLLTGVKVIDLLTPYLQGGKIGLFGGAGVGKTVLITEMINTAVEAAVALHSEVVQRIDEIEKIVLTTHESAIRIISKTGPLNNPADRDHCLQYMAAIGLLKGDLKADDYENSVAIL